MKKQGYTIEFFIIFLILILPPLIFNRSAPLMINPVYSFQHFCLFALAFVLYFHQNQDDENNQNRESKGLPSLFALIRQSGFFFVSFGLLCVISALVQALSHLSGLDAPVEAVAPEKLYLWINCIAGTFLAAFYEEMVFRSFAPDRLAKIFGDQNRFVRLAWEGAMVILFAVSHLYAGFFSFVNALCAGVVLRITLIKCGSVGTVSLAHGLYNMLSLLIMMHL